jgi:ferric-dicitrate binding protein FerR (iron transport regulator)
MEEFKAKKIIVKYLANEATSLEKEQLLNWVQAKENQEIFKQFLKAQLIIDLKYNALDSEIAYDNFLKQIHKDKKTWSFKSFIPYLKYAAIITGIFFSLFYFIKQKETPSSAIDLGNEVYLQVINDHKEYFKIDKDKEVSSKEGVKYAKVVNGVLKYIPRNHSNKSEKIQHVLSVPYGKIFEVILADGSLVHLNSGSTLKYPSVFNKNEPRVVFLEGEAFFKVSKKLNTSFVVNTRTSTTKVFGTEFNVSSYLEDEKTEIVLVEGSVGIKKNVEINNNEYYTIIKPSQKVTLTDSSNDLKITTVDVKKYVAWKDGVLIFENEKFENIIKTLERQYNIKIINNFNEIDNLSFNGNFQNDSIEKILNTIKTHTDFSFQRKKDTIIINNPKSK